MRRRVPIKLRPLTPVDRFSYVMGGIVVPALCFLIAAAFPGAHPAPASKEEGWRAIPALFFHREASWGFVILLAVSAVALSTALIDPRRAGGSALVRVGILGGILVSATYIVAGGLGEDGTSLLLSDAGALIVYAILRRLSMAFPAFGNVALLVPPGLLGALAILDSGAAVMAIPVGLWAGPAWSLAAYGAMWLRLRRESFGEPPRTRGPLALWLAGYGAALAHAIVAANRLYRDLPDHPPDSCYVATAAARGHRRVVGSWPVGRRRVNAQLIWLKRGEIVLLLLAPGVHRTVRRMYDRVGPPVAARLRHPLAADVAYLSLKPFEWAVRGAFLFTRVPTARSRRCREDRAPRDPPRHVLPGAIGDQVRHEWRRCDAASH